MTATNRVGFHYQGHPIRIISIIQRHRPAIFKAHLDHFGFDLHTGIPVLHSHDWVDDMHTFVEEFQVFGLVCGAPDIGVSRVGLLHAGAVAIATRLQPLAHLFAPTQLSHELHVEPRLIYFQVGIGKQTIAVEALDVVALVGTAITPNVHAVLFHGIDQHRARHGAAQWGGVEIRLASAADVERTTLQRDQALIDQRATAVDQTRLLGFVFIGPLGDVVVVVLVILAKICCIAIRDRTLFAHPCNGTTGVKAARKGDTDFFVYRK